MTSQPIKVTGSYTLDAPREQIWPLIHDSASLVRLIPGCEKLEQVGSPEYHEQMQLWLAVVAGKYETYIKLTESKPYHQSL
jgi:carbon monoxide dehydrogenase subunit G